MDFKQKIVIGILLGSAFIFLSLILILVFSLYSNGEQIPAILRPFIEYHIQFMIAMGLLGIFSGVSIYSILNSTIETQKKTMRSNSELLLKFLSNEDRDIVELMLKKDNITTQSEVAKLPGMSRLKAHRMVKRLESRGIIHVEKYGKINLLRLADELKIPE